MSAELQITPAFDCTNQIELRSGEFQSPLCHGTCTQLSGRVLRAYFDIGRFYFNQHYRDVIEIPPFQIEIALLNNF